MLTFKFDYTDAENSDQGCIKIRQGKDLWYQSRQIKGVAEWKDFVSTLPSFQVIGITPEMAITKGDEIPIHIVYMQWPDQDDYLINVILCGGICYVMNEDGKTVDIIH